MLMLIYSWYCPSYHLRRIVISPESKIAIYHCNNNIPVYWDILCLLSYLSENCLQESCRLLLAPTIPRVDAATKHPWDTVVVFTDHVSLALLCFSSVVKRWNWTFCFRGSVGVQMGWTLLTGLSCGFPLKAFMCLEARVFLRWRAN